MAHLTNNYLFVDIDGPLLPKRMHIHPDNVRFLEAFDSGVTGPEIFERTPPRFDEWGVMVHNMIARYAQAKVVIVTNWRQWWDIPTLQNMFAAQGLEFEYAERPSCIKRGLSSQRYHDISSHIEDELPANSRALIIDDYNLTPLFGFHEIEDRDAYPDDPSSWCPRHKDEMIGICRENDVRFRWLAVDYDDGISYNQFKLAMHFFDLDVKNVRWQESQRQP